MRVLIVDDNAARVSVIVRRLVEDCSLDHSDIINSRCAYEARASLSSEKFDLMLLDIRIPGRLDDAPDVAHSLQLLAEVEEGAALLMPGKIVGMTAYDDAALAAQQAFKDATWTLIVTSEISDGWCDTVVNCVRYLQLEAGQRSTSHEKVDVLVISALSSEIEAIRSLSWSWTAPEPVDDTAFISRGVFISNGRQFTVASTHAARMGMVSSAVLTSKLVATLSPKICVMPGICAGLPGRAEIGDVVLAECSWDYQSGRYAVDADGGSVFQQDPHQVSVDVKVVTRVDEMARDSHTLYAIWDAWPTKPKTPFAIKRGPMACGSAVLANSDYVAEIQRQNRKLRAIEMESYGFLHAISVANEPRPLAIVAKSVCDFADNLKGDDYQAYACYTSAQTVRAFLERFATDLT